MSSEDRCEGDGVRKRRLVKLLGGTRMDEVYTEPTRKREPTRSRSIYRFEHA